MNRHALFEESQKFRQWWLWLIMLGINGLFLFGIYMQIVLGQQFGNNPMGNLWLLVVYFFILLLTVFFAVMRLDTRITDDGVSVRFFPFRRSFRHYRWEEIIRAYVRKYNPIGEYGGWGVRGTGKDKAYNVSGNDGLQLVFHDGRKLLVGTRRPDEVAKALEKAGIAR